jgi:predicted nucleic acid-binding protein
MPSASVVVDADVMVGALEATDSHHAAAAEWFRAWQPAGTRRVASVLNLTETLVRPAEDPRSLSQARAALSRLGVSPHTPTITVAVDAARLRASHPISLADAYLLATARHLEAAVASFDAEVNSAAEHEHIPLA